MEIIFKLEKEKIKKLYTECIVETIAFKKVLAQWRLIFRLFTIVAIISDHSLKNIAFYLVANLLFTYIFKIIARVIYKISFSKHYNSEDLKYMFNNIKVTFSEETLEYKTDVSSVCFDYSSIEAINYVSNYIFIVIKNKKNLFIPDSVFEVDGEFDRFTEFIKEKTRISPIYTYPEEINFL